MGARHGVPSMRRERARGRDGGHTQPSAPRVEHDVRRCGTKDGVGAPRPSGESSCGFIRIPKSERRRDCSRGMRARSQRRPDSGFICVSSGFPQHFTSSRGPFTVDAGRPTNTRRKGIYLLPNLLTTGALFAGFYSIVAAIDGNFPVGRVGDLRGDVPRRPRRPRRAAHEHLERVRQGVRQSLRHGVVRLGARDRHLPMGRRAARRVRRHLGPARLARGVPVCAAAAFRLARFNTNVGQDRRFFQGLAEPAGGCRCRVHGVARDALPDRGAHRARCGNHGDRRCGPADDVAVRLCELQGRERGQASAVRESAVDPARDHRDRDRAASDDLHPVPDLCVVGAGRVVVASAPRQAAGRGSEP